MKIYKTQAKVEADIEGGILDCNYEDVRFECSIVIEASIINAHDIIAHNINAHNIIAHDIIAHDINVHDIIAHDINAHDIIAHDINVHDIIVRDISYYAFCIAYKSIKCKSWKKRRDNALDPICLDEKLEIIQDDEIDKAIKLLESRGKLKDGKILT
jgi:hypothetical protein